MKPVYKKLLIYSNLYGFLKLVRNIKTLLRLKHYLHPTIYPQKKNLRSNHPDKNKNVDLDLAKEIIAAGNVVFTRKHNIT